MTEHLAEHKINILGFAMVFLTFYILIAATANPWWKVRFPAPEIVILLHQNILKMAVCHVGDLWQN